MVCLSSLIANGYLRKTRVNSLSIYVGGKQEGKIKHKHNPKALNICPRNIFGEDNMHSIKSLATEFDNKPEIEGWVS